MKQEEKVLGGCVGGLLLISGVLFTGLFVSGCAAGVPYTSEGYIALTADRKGMQAFGDALNGMITNGKASPDVDTYAWKTRRVQDHNETMRHMKPSFVSSLFAPKNKPAVK